MDQNSRLSAQTTNAVDNLSAKSGRLIALYPEFEQLTTESDIKKFKNEKKLTDEDIKLLVRMTKDPNVRERVSAVSVPTAHRASLPKQMANTNNLLYDFFQLFTFQRENYPIVYYNNTPNEIFEDTYFQNIEKRQQFIDAIHLQHTDPVEIPLNELKPNVKNEIFNYIAHGQLPSLHLLQNQMPIIHNDLKEAVEKYEKGGSPWSSQKLTKQKTRGTKRPKQQYAVSDIPLYFVIYSPRVYHMSVIVLHGSRVYSFGFGYFGDTGDKKDEVKMNVLGRLTEQFHVQLGAIYTPDYLINRNNPNYDYTIVDIGVFQPKHIENLEAILKDFKPGSHVSIEHATERNQFKQLINNNFIFKPTRFNLTMDPDPKKGGKYHSICNVYTKNMNCTNFIEKIFGTDRISCSYGTNIMSFPHLCIRKPTELTIEETKRVFDMYQNNQYDDMIAYLGVSRPKLIVQPEPKPMDKVPPRKGPPRKTQRGPSQRGPSQRSPSQRGPSQRGPSQRGPTGSQSQTRKRPRRE